MTLFSVVVALPLPKLTPTNVLASSLVMSWQGSRSVATAVGSGVPLASSDAGADDGAGDALGAGAWIGGGLALTMAAAICGRRRRAGARAAGDRERGDEGEGARLAPANDPNLGHGLVPPGVTASDAREERDGLGDPVDGEVRALVQLADQPFVAGREQREHHLIDRHEDRTDVLDRVALVRHRPRRRLEARQGGDERGEVDARPVALDQEGRERGWIARSVHAADDGRRAPPDERGDYPDQSVVGAFRIHRHQGPELGPRVDAELLVDPAEDVADGLGGEERALGDLAAGEA